MKIEILDEAQEVRRMRVLRYLGAVLAAGTASWLCPFLLAGFVFVTDTKVDNLGRIDNAPYRAAGGLLFLTPFFIIMFGLFFLASSAVLRLLHRYSLHTRHCLSDYGGLHQRLFRCSTPIHGWS